MATIKGGFRSNPIANEVNWFQRIITGQKINAVHTTPCRIKNICGPEFSGGKPISYRGTKGVSLLVEPINEAGKSMDITKCLVEVDCEMSYDELRSIYGSDANLIGKKVDVKHRGLSEHALSMGKAKIVNDQDVHYPDITRNGVATLGALTMGGGCREDPVGSIGKVLTGLTSANGYDGEFA